MIRLVARWSAWLVAATVAAPEAWAQTSEGWQACRTAPTRACVFAEAVRRVRDDAPSRDVPRFAAWEAGLHVRLSEIAAATRDRALFTEARRLARLDPEPGARDAALRRVGLAQARAGFVDDAAVTVEGLSDPGPVPAEIAAVRATSGRLGEAVAVIERIASPAARAFAWTRLARVTGDLAWFEKAAHSLRDIEDPYIRGSQHRWLAVAHAELGHLDRALRTIGDIAVRPYQAQALVDIARLTGNPAYIDEARRRTAGLYDHAVDLEAWQAIVRAQIALGRLDDALRSLKRPELALQPGTLAEDAGALATAFWLRDGPARAEAVLREILDGFADRFWGPARFALAIGLADAGRFDSARLMAFLAGDADVDRALGHIAVGQARARAFNAALDTADTVKSPAERSPALARIAALLPE